MKDFKSLQQEIIIRGKAENACGTGLDLVRSTTNKVELLKAILEYWEWCFEDYEIVDDDFIIDNFSREQIKESGIYLIEDKEAYKEEIKSFSLPTEGWEDILLGSEVIRIARTNLKDEEFAKRNFNGDFISPTGEHHFEFDRMQKALEKAGCKTLTVDQQVELSRCVNVWDNNLKGRWFKVPTQDGSTVDLFFPAAGYRGNTTGGLYYVGSSGYYWSSLVSSTTYAYLLYFNSSTVSTRYSLYRSFGFSVRCVAPQN